MSYIVVTSKKHANNVRETEHVYFQSLKDALKYADESKQCWSSVHIEEYNYNSFSVYADKIIDDINNMSEDDFMRICEKHGYHPTKKENNMNKTQQKIDEIDEQIKSLEKRKSELSRYMYPIFKMSPTGSLIVKISDSDTCEIVASKNKNLSVGFLPIVDTILETWNDVPYDEKRGLFHGQLVWAWDDEDSHIRILGFYNEKDDALFRHDGLLGLSLRFNNYASYEGEWPEWAYEPFGTLELGI